jgi:hypothetical protein
MCLIDYNMIYSLEKRKCILKYKKEIYKYKIIRKVIRIVQEVDQIN